MTPPLDKLLRALPWRECRPGYADEVGAHSYLVRGTTIDEATWKAVAAAIARDGVVERYRHLGQVHRYLHVTLGGVPYRLWAMGSVLNRAARTLDDHEVVTDQQKR